MAGSKIKQIGENEDSAQRQRRANMTADERARILQNEKNKDRRNESKTTTANTDLVPPPIGGGLNLRGAKTALERSLLKTGTERRAGRIGFYDTLRGLRRSQKGTESQMGSVAAEMGNRRSPAFASGVGQVRANTVAGMVKSMRDRATSESALVERDRAAREQFEKAVVEQYWQRAASMDARAREFLKSQIFDNLNINVDDVATTITGGK